MQVLNFHNRLLSFNQSKNTYNYYNSCNYSNLLYWKVNDFWSVRIFCKWIDINCIECICSVSINSNFGINPVFSIFIDFYWCLFVWCSSCCICFSIFTICNWNFYKTPFFWMINIKNKFLILLIYRNWTLCIM